MKIILLMAMTLDGKIAKRGDHYPDWTGKADKRLFAEISRRAGAVIMGSRTHDTIGNPLPDRLNIVMTRHPSRRCGGKNLIFTAQSPRDIVHRLKADGFTEAVLAGGATINTLFARDHLIDEIVVTISPKTFGTGISLFSGSVDLDLDLEKMHPLDAGVIALTYRVIPPEKEST